MSAVAQSLACTCLSDMPRQVFHGKSCCTVVASFSCDGGFERPVLACSPLCSCPAHLPYRFAPTHGVCIGQASVPGPAGQSTLHSFFARRQPPPVDRHGFQSDPAAADSTFLLAVVNPTSVLNKSRSLLKLGAEVLMLAETSAVTKVQTLVWAEMRRHAYQVFWGQPVPSHAREGSCKEILRGHAAGVAGSSLPDELSVTCRVSECFIRLGGLAVRVITVYGHTPDSGQSQQLNAALFDKVKARVISSAVPAIVGGDFNQQPQTIPACQDLLDRGYREADAFHRLKTGFPARVEAAPPTTPCSYILTLSLYGILPRSKVVSWNSIHTTHSWSDFTCPLPRSLGSLGLCRNPGLR